MRVEADLVASRLPVLAELQPELEPRIAVVQQAGASTISAARSRNGSSVDAHQRRRHDPEQRQRRVAAADLGLAREGGAEAALVREPLELRAGVGDRGELSAAASRPLPEVLQVRARLERRARLRGGDEERPLELELLSSAADRRRMRRVEHVERFRRERRAAAPRARARSRPSRAGRSSSNCSIAASANAFSSSISRRDSADHVEPAEPAILAGVGPERRVAGPDPLDDRAHAASRRRELRALGLIPFSSSSNESANFCTPSRSSVSVTSS